MSSGICASSCPRSPHNKSSQGSEVPKCDRGCQCFNQAQLIWVIRPNSHCRNQRWSRLFPVGNMPCSCISSVICKTAAVREVVLLNSRSPHTGLLGAPWPRVGFGCAGQVDAVAPPSFSSHSLDIMSPQGFNGVVRNFSCLSILGVERTHTRCTKACGLSATRASIRVTERDSPELVTSTRHQSNSRL